jgi:hypothetical protein
MLDVYGNLGSLSVDFTVTVVVQSIPKLLISWYEYYVLVRTSVYSTIGIT